MIAVLISAIRLCYRIEARSEGLGNRSGVPGNAMWLHVIINSGVASDDRTQALRRRMNISFAAIVAGFALLCLALWSAGAFERQT